MDNYISFINSKDISKNPIALSLNCSNDEIKILQFMSKGLLNNQNNFLVKNIIENVFKLKGTKALKHIYNIKSLLNLDFIYITNDSNEDLLLLELFNSYIGLTHHFLNILENGKSKFKIPKITAYKSDLEYIKDEFLKIEIIEKLAILRKTQKHDYYFQNKQNLKLIESCINKRLKITKQKINIIRFLESFNLSENEKIIFFALLREEYSLINAKNRELNFLLDLISNDESERIINKSIFHDEGKLIQCELIDYYEDIMRSLKDGGAKNFYIPEQTMQKIINSQTSKISHKMNLDSSIQNQDIFELINTKCNIDDVVLDSSTKERLDILIQQLDKNVIKLLQKWGIKNNKGINAKIIFYGGPGTGKTITAHALGNSLKKPILSLDCSKILSMYVGESERNVRKIFDTYYEITSDYKDGAILLLDEADQFLGARSTAIDNSVDKMYNQMQNIFLEQIEKFDGILIATTNLLENIDKAFSRRFNYKIEFHRPSFKQRKEIWQRLLPKSAKYSDDVLLDKLASFDITGGQIKLIITNTAYKVATRKPPIFNLNDFIVEIKKEIDSNFNNLKSLGFL